MVDGIVLSRFDDIKGFVPIIYYPSNLKPQLVNLITIRATIFPLGTTDESIRCCWIDLYEWIR